MGLELTGSGKDPPVSALYLELAFQETSVEERRRWYQTCSPFQLDHKIKNRNKQFNQNTKQQTNSMKFSTSFTLAAMTLMSTCTDARIGDGQRELKQKCGLNPACPTGEVCNKTSVGYLCEEPDAPMCGLNPACPTGETCSKTSVGYLCIDFDISKKCDPNLGGQCFSEGTDYTCENSRVQGESPDYRCVQSK